MTQVIIENPVLNSPYQEPTLKRRRPKEVAFLLAKLVFEKYFRDEDGNAKPWLFPQILRIATRWMDECLTCKDNTFPQLLLLVEFAHDAADRIYKAIVASAEGTLALKPIPQPYDTVGSTRWVDSTPPARSGPRAPTSATSRTLWPTRSRGSRSSRRHWRTCPKWWRT